MFPEQLPDTFSLVRQHQFWPDIREQLKDKLSQVNPRVRYLQSLTFNVAAAAVEQVNIDRSRNIFWVIAPPAESFFDSNELLKQTRGITFVIKFNDGV
jgi:hypothetical protein